MIPCYMMATIFGRIIVGIISVIVLLSSLMLSEVNGQLPTQTPLGCYKIDKGNPAFLISAGDYDPDSLTVQDCLVACAGFSFKFAALEGQICLCSNVNYPSALKQADDTGCAGVCTGDATQKCGNSDYSLVYDVANDAAAIQLRSNETYVAGTAKSVPATVDGTNLVFNFDYGDGGRSVQQEPYIYAIPGEYIVSATVENLKGVAADAVQVTVEMAINRAKMNCPDAAELNEEFSCTLEVYEGSNIKATFDLNRGARTFDTYIGTPSFFDVGVCAQSQGTITNPNPFDAAWVIPSSEFRNPGRVIAFETYITSVGDGQLSILILRPTCSGGKTWCPISNFCQNSCDWATQNGDPLSFDTCSGSELYCPYSSTCVGSADPYTCPLSILRASTQTSDAPRADYTVVKAITRTVTAGFNYLKLDDIATDMLPEVQVGDVLGFLQTSAGARIGAEPVTNSAVEFRYSGAVATEGSTLAIASGSGISKWHHIKAIVSQPAITSFKHAFDKFGDMRIQASLTNPITTTPVVAWTLIGIQSTILGLSVEVEPTQAPINTPVTLMLRVASGNPVIYNIDWDDGNIELNISRRSESFDEPDNITHTYTAQDGLLTINVTGSNLLNKEVKQTTVMIQRPIVKSQYVVTSNSPQPHPCYPCQAFGVIQFTVTLENPTNAPIGTLPMITISSGTFGNASDIALAGLANHGDSTTVDYMIRFPGDYQITYRISNLVSGEDYKFGLVSTQIPIAGFVMKAKYKPVLGGQNDLLPGSGATEDSFAINLPVVFVFEARNGTGITVTFSDFGDGTPAGQTTKCDTMSECRLEHKYASVGTYTVTATADNSITSPPATSSVTIKVQENIGDITVKELNKAAAGEAKRFEIKVGSIGTASCLMIDPNDKDGGSDAVFYGTQATCAKHDSYSAGKFVSALSNQFILEHTYDENGSYKLKMLGFNQVTSAEFSHSFAIIGIPCDVPQLEIEKHYPQVAYPNKYFKSQEILLEVLSKLDCTVINNLKSWKLETINRKTQQTNQTYSLDDTTSPYYLKDGAKTGSIRIPPHFLQFGIYKLTFTMTIDAASTGGVELTNSISQFIEVERAPLIVLLVPGQTTSTIVGFGESLEFNPAKYSINPNLRKGEDPRFDTATFKYFCSRFYEELPLNDNREYDETPIEIPEPGANITDRGGCFFTGPGKINHTKGSLTISTKGMQVNMTHDMVVLVQKDGLEGKAKFRFTVKEGTYPQPIVSYGGGTNFEVGYGAVVFNPTSDIRLAASCEKGCSDNMGLEWDLYVDDGVNRYQLPGWQASATGLSTNRLFLSKDVFALRKNATQYEVSVIMTNDVGYSGKAHILMEPNKPPRGGRCNITQSAITVGDKLDVTCSDWEDDNGIDFFKYFVERKDYFIPISLPVLRSVGSGETSVVATLEPPAGTKSIDYRMKLKCEIWDKLGAMTEHVIGEIEVLPNGTLNVADPQLVNDIQGEVNLLVAEGNAREIYKKLQSLASLLNDQRETEQAVINDLTSTNDSRDAAADAAMTGANNKEYRGYLRSRIVSMCADLAFNTMEDVQLAANSLSVCSKQTDELSRRAQDLLVTVYKRLLDKVDELAESAQQDTVVLVMNTILDNIGNALEAVFESTANPLTLLEKNEAEGGDYTTLQNMVNAAQRTKGSITTTLPATTAKISDASKAAREQKANRITNALEALRKRAQGILLKNKFADEPQTVYKSNTITSRVGRAKVESILGSVTFEDENGGPTFPPLGVLFANASVGKNDVIDAETSSTRKNARNYDSSSAALSEDTEVQEIGFKSPNGSEIVIKDLKEPILVRIARPKGQIPQMTEFDPENNTDAVTGMSCHKVPVPYDSLSITVDFTPYNLSLPYELYINYAVFPTLEIYDIKVPLFNESSEFWKNGTFSVFVSDNYITNNTGAYFVCLRELTVFEGSLDYYNTSNNFSGPYFLRIVQTGCRFWDKQLDKWSSEGTSVDSRSNDKWAYCLTTHLSSFASAWLVPPTPLDFNYIFANAGFAQNLTIYITTIVVYVLFFFVFIWARRKDKKDVVLLGVTPLPDNTPGDKYIYEIVVCTGQRQNAGTKSKVSFILSGDQDETDARTFEDNMRPILTRSAQDRFLLSTPRPLGTLNYMRLWHDNSGKGEAQSWYLQYIAIRDLQTRERFYFIVNNWFSLVEGDGEADRLVPVAGKEQMQSFDHVFYGHTRKNLNDGHIWFSIFARPAGSRFTRLQRAACCMMLLWLEMLVNIMYYKMIPPTPAANALNIGPFSLSPAQVSIGIQSAIIVFPVSLLVVQLFRKARPKKKRASRIETAKKEQRTQTKLGKDRSKAYVSNDPLSASSINISEKYEYDSSSGSPRSLRSESQLIPDDGRPTGDPKVIKEEKKKVKHKTSSWPWWTIVPGWIIVILVTLTATTFTVFYGISFGNKTTSEWLASFVVTTITGILFTQPIKVIAMGIFIALVLKTPNADEDNDMEDDEEDFELAPDEEWLHGRSDAPVRRKIPYRPPDPERIARMREKRIKELEMYSIIREIILYIIFLWVVMMLSYGNQDANAYPMKEQITNTLVGADGIYTFDNIVTIEQFWLWVHRGLVPNLYAGDWYNGRDSGQAAENFFGDRLAFIVGYPVMRQVRVRPDLCKTHDKFEKYKYIDECNVPYGISDEDEQTYNKGWKLVNASTTNPKDLPKEWKYTPWDELDGYPFYGRHAVYVGGGYVAELNDPNKLAAKMKELDDNAWVDRYTRAVFVEFSTYNAQVNLFAVVTLVVEFLSSGGGFPTPRVDVLRLLTYYEGFALVQVCCEASFLVFIAFFVVKEVRAAIKQKKKYWKEFWNVAEWLIIGFSTGLIIMYFYRFYTTKSVLNDMKSTGGRGYVKLQYVAYWNELLGIMIGWVVFMATLKFIKLLRFNRRMSLLSSTIRVATNDLIWFSMFFGIVFIGFCIVFYLILGGKVFNYSDFIYTMESLITAILGSFHFGELVEAERLLGPILFFVFMGSITFILINMLLTIINEAFQQVKADLENQPNDYEMVDFMVSRFKAFLGMQQQVDTMTTKDLEKEVAENASKDTVEMFPDKVDQLLNHIAKTYFNQENFDDIIKNMGGGNQPKKPRKVTAFTA